MMEDYEKDMQEQRRDYRFIGWYYVIVFTLLGGFLLTIIFGE